MPIKLCSKIKVSDLIVPEEYSLEKIGLTQSLLSKFQCCRKCFLINLNRWIAPEKEHITGYGSMVHEVLDTLYTGHMKGHFEESDFIDVITSRIDNFEFGKIWNQQDVEIAKAKAQAILEVYIKIFKKDFTNIRFEGVEETFCVPFDDILLRGKIDGKFRDKQGNHWNMEHKNYSRINTEIMPMLLNFDLQNLFYMLCEEIKNNSRLNGTLYNIIRNPQVRKKDGDAAAVYRLIKEKVTGDPSYYFYRYWIPYSRKQFETFKRELSFKISDIKFALSVPKRSQNKMFYKNEQGCYGMSYTCEYVQACSLDSLNGYIQKSTLFNEL